MKGLLVVAIAATLGLGLAERGHACSMTAPAHPAEPRASVADADAIFTGTLIAVRPKDPGAMYAPAPQIYTFAVEERLKGDLGERVEATHWSCGGFNGAIGQRGSFLLSRAGGEWFVNEVGAETLQRGLLPWPTPTGAGRPAFVAGGHFGLIRTALLDSGGRTIAYGGGRGAVTALSVCPGGRMLAELVRLDERIVLALRELPSMRVAHELELRATGFGQNVVCTRRDGSDVIVGAVLYGRSRTETQLLRVTSIGTRMLAAAPSLSFAIRGTRVYVSLSDGRLVVRDLASAMRRTVPRIRVALRALSVSADGRVVAGLSDESLVVVDLVRGSTVAMPWLGGVGTRWIARRTLAAWSRAGLQILDETLRPVRSPWDWRVHTTAVVGGSVFGVDWEGRFLTQRNGRVIVLGTLFSPAVTVLETI